MPIALLVFALLAALLGPAGCTAQERQKARVVEEIPFEFDGHLFFAAMVNDEPARLLFDPVGGLMLDRRYALRRPAWHRDWRAAGMAGPTRVGGAGPDEVEVTFADSVTLTLGNLRRRYQRVPVIPLDSMMGSVIAGTADGLLGTTVLAEYALHLDFGTRRARLLDPTTIDTAGWQVLPLTFVGARASVPVTIRLPDGSREMLRTQVDWGMAGGLRVVTREVNARGLIRHAADTAGDLRGRGLGGRLLSVVVDGVSIELGMIVSQPHEVLLARERTGADANPPYDALLGLELLADFDVIYDPTNARLLLQRPNRP